MKQMKKFLLMATAAMMVAATAGTRGIVIEGKQKVVRK